MARWRTPPLVERKKLLEEKKYYERQGVQMPLIHLTDEKPQTTPQQQIQLELPLEWSHHATPEPLLKVSEPCTNQTQYQLLTKNK